MEKEKPKRRYELTWDNLAFPEVHTGRAAPQTEEPEPEAEVLYDGVAVPEVRPLRRKKKDDKK